MSTIMIAGEREVALKHLSQHQGTFLQSLGDVQLCCPSPIILVLHFTRAS